MFKTSLMQPVDALQGVKGYAVPRARAPIDLKLDGNEGCAPAPSWFNKTEFRETELNRYPSLDGLREQIAQRHGVNRENVFIAAGADEVLDRICRAMLAPGRELLWLEPGFEMVPKYARLAGATIREVPWPDSIFPIEKCLSVLGENTSLGVLTSPNNPTGAVVPASAFQQLTQKSPQTLFVVDEAYAEFSEHSLETEVLGCENAILLRTLSKAWGLAGLRVGYGVSANVEVIRWLEAVGSPYPVSVLSAQLASKWLKEGEGFVQNYIRNTRTERTALYDVLANNGMDPLPSEGNFVFARHPAGLKGALWLRDAMSGLGIGIRAFPTRVDCHDAVRITCPGNPDAFARLQHGVDAALRPGAILFDLDGVLADVGESYREAILQTAKYFGVEISNDDVDAEKRLGNANDDWALTHRLLQKAGVSVSLENVTGVFEGIYQGSETEPGLKARERLLVAPERLRELANHLPLAIVTGRPRDDAEWFLGKMEIRRFFQEVICREDAPLKPRPDPVELALRKLNVKSAWMIGDTPDDIVASRSAGVVPLGVLAGSSENASELEDALYQAGAARVFSSTLELFELWKGLQS